MPRTTTKPSSEAGAAAVDHRSSLRLATMVAIYALAPLTIPAVAEAAVTLG